VNLRLLSSMPPAIPPQDLSQRLPRRHKWRRRAEARNKDHALPAHHRHTGVDNCKGWGEGGGEGEGNGPGEGKASVEARPWVGAKKFVAR